MVPPALAGRRAMAAVRERIRALTDRRFVGRSVAEVAENVSRVLRRWAPYYRSGNSARRFSSIDRYARRSRAWAILCPLDHEPRRSRGYG